MSAGVAERLQCSWKFRVRVGKPAAGVQVCVSVCICASNKCGFLSGMGAPEGCLRGNRLFLGCVCDARAPPALPSRLQVGKKVTLEELVNKDAEDESLRRYKESLLGAAAHGGAFTPSASPCLCVCLCLCGCL